LLQAKNIFCKKFSDKTYNNWDERHSFVKHPGKYDLVHKDYDDFKTEEEKLDIKKESNENVDIPASILDKPVQELIELICNVNEMEALLKEMKYDAKKSPLGKLSKTQIKAGYSSLKLIEELVRNKNSGRDLVDANNEFYTRIPHDFGMRKPPLISTLPQVREKIRLLEVLDDIEVAVKAMNQKSEIVNPIDRHYDQLECKLKAISNDHKMFKVIEVNSYFIYMSEIFF
jgi:poly [ADP-ribose] polymerase